MSDLRHLKNSSYVNGHVRVDLEFAKYGDRFPKAQQWLGNQILTDCKPYMPLRTGSQQQRSYVTEGGKQVVFPGPYARYLYMGKVMVDAETGKGPANIPGVGPRFRKGAVLVATDRDLQFQVGSAHWFDVAHAEHGNEWVRGCAKIIAGGNDG